MGAPGGYSFAITLAELRGLTSSSDDSRYCVAWRCGEQQGKTPRVARGRGGEARFDAVATLVTGAQGTEAGSHLLELHVKEYDGDGKRSKRALGVLCLDLAMHFPKNGQTEARQSACLPLSNSVDPALRLALTVHCSARPAAAPAGSPAAALPASKHTSPPRLAQCRAAASDGGPPGQRLLELADENARLRRQIEALQREGSYTYTNNPVRRYGSAAEGGAEGELARLRRDLSTRDEELRQAHREARELADALCLADARREEAEAAQRRGAAGEEANLRRLVSELRDQLEAERRQRLQDVDERVRGAEQRARRAEEQRDAAAADLQAARAERDELRHRLRSAEETCSDTRAELQRRLHDAEERCASYQERAARLQEDVLARDASQSEQAARTEQAKGMLQELMGRVKELQRREEGLQSALAVAEEQSGKQNVEIARLLHAAAEARAAAQEEIGRADGAAAQAAAELQRERRRSAEFEEDARRLANQLSAARDSAAAAAAEHERLRALSQERKQRIADLKRLLSLHLRVQGARSGDADSGSATSEALVAAFGEAAASAAALLRHQ
eukprot:TRINITY_DN3105_c0_g1_i1.p1 TRINITY_DN3105_c0_g1~~TRINITY_DN3105_c0_g1_i1.p1  ORF type:complete len:602 (+),score=259.23 TRINITY_DN3105_c0_g1_i1:116-1807(+)